MRIISLHGSTRARRKAFADVLSGTLNLLDLKTKSVEMRDLAAEHMYDTFMHITESDFVLNDEKTVRVFMESFRMKHSLTWLGFFTLECAMMENIGYKIIVVVDAQTTEEIRRFKELGAFNVFLMDETDTEDQPYLVDTKSDELFHKVLSTLEDKDVIAESIKFGKWWYINVLNTVAVSGSSADVSDIGDVSEKWDDMMKKAENECWRDVV